MLLRRRKLIRSAPTNGIDVYRQAYQVNTHGEIENRSLPPPAAANIDGTRG